MIKNKPAKFENDDYSRMAGRDYKEESFEIGNEKSHLDEIHKPQFNGGMSSELKNDKKKTDPMNKRSPVSGCGPEEATRRDLGVEED